MRNILLAFGGQSNQQGAARAEGGVVKKYATSEYLAQTDPFTGCNNTGQGGSMFPYLIDLGRRREVNYTIRNFCIGGASTSQHTGITGSTVTGGSASTPAALGYMPGNITLVGGAGLPVEGDVDYDPFGFLSRARAGIVAASPGNFDAVITAFANGESDAGVTSNFYRDRLQSIATYMLADGNVDAHFIGLSSKPPAFTTQNYVDLQSGVSLAIAALVGAGKPVFAGGDLFAWYGANPPLHPELDATTRVHLTLRGQQVQAWLWDRKFAAAGY